MTLEKSCMIRYHFPFQHTDAQELRSNPSTANPFSPLRLHPIPIYHEAIRLCLSQGTADLGAALAGRQAGSLEGGLGGLGDLLISLGEDELDVAGVGHVGVDLKGKKSVPLVMKG